VGLFSEDTAEDGGRGVSGRRIEETGRPPEKRYVTYVHVEPEMSMWLNGLMIWDYMYPTFDCPYLPHLYFIYRLSNLGDGGMWVCGLREIRKRSNCLVLRLPSRRNSSGEPPAADYGCPTQGSKSRVLSLLPIPIADDGGRANFTEFGLGGSGRGKGRAEDCVEDWPCMDNGYTLCWHILKMDIEGDDRHFLAQAVYDFPDSFPFRADPGRAPHAVSREGHKGALTSRSV
jgi:hypothetical protein